MTFPFESKFIFEHSNKGHMWRVQLCNYNGNGKVSVWPWYEAQDGLRPCKASFIRNGLQMPPERLWALGEAIMAAKAEIESSGA